MVGPSETHPTRLLGTDIRATTFGDDRNTVTIGERDIWIRGHQPRNPRQPHGTIRTPIGDRRRDAAREESSIERHDHLVGNRCRLESIDTLVLVRPDLTPIVKWCDTTHVGPFTAIWVSPYDDL